MGRQQSGFSSIELLITLSIMMVMASLAITTYSNYSQRANVSTGLALTSPIRLAVHEYFTRTNRFPDNNAAAGIPPPDAFTDTNVRTIHIKAMPSPGTIAIVYKGKGGISEGDTLLLIPTASGNNIRWRCLSYTLLGKLLPASCR